MSRPRPRRARAGALSSRTCRQLIGLRAAYKQAAGSVPPPASGSASPTAARVHSLTPPPPPPVVHAAPSAHHHHYHSLPTHTPIGAVMSQPPQPHRAYDEGSYDLYNHALYQSSNSDPTAQPQGHATSYSTSSVGPDPAQQHARKRSAFAADADLSGYSEARDSSTALAEPLPGKGQISADGYASPSPDDKWAPGLVSPPSLSHAFTPPHLVAGSFTPLDGSPGDSVDFLSPGAGAGSTSAHARAASGGASPLPASSASSTALPSPARDGAGMPGSASRYGLVDPNMGVSALYYHDLGDLDDDLHRVGPNDAKGAPETNKGVSARGVLNIATMVILVLALLMLFAGYPIMTAVRTKHDALGAFGPGGTNGSGQVSSVPGVRTSLIDPDTPQDAYTRQSGVESSTMHLVFSDEFNAPGRSFYPGDEYVFLRVALSVVSSTDN